MKYRPLICKLVDGVKNFITVPSGKEIIYVSYKRDTEHYSQHANIVGYRLVNVAYMFVLFKTGNSYECVDFLCPGTDRLNTEFIAVNYATTDMIMAIENSNNFIKLASKFKSKM